jgi:acyl carrier protein
VFTSLLPATPAWSPITSRKMARISVLPRFETHLVELLPGYMLPQHYVRLERIPLTPNRKADRKALPLPGPAMRREVVAPRTAAESMVADIWKRVLGAEEVGVGDDFFELGGHSILATRVIARLRDELGIQLPLRRLFENSSLESLAGHVATLMALRDVSGDIDSGDREEMAF